MGKRLCNGDFSFLSMPLVLSIKDQSRLPKSLLIGNRCLDRVLFCLKPFNCNDFSLKLRIRKYYVSSQPFLCKNLKSSFPRKLNWLHLQHQSATCFAQPVVFNQIIDKNLLRIVTLLLYSNKINSLNSE